MAQLVTQAFRDRPAFDTAVSAAILQRVARGELPDTIRLARPGAMVAFGKQDVSSAGYEQAAAAAEDRGFAAIKRLAGGRAAVFHEETIALAWAERNPDPWPGTHDRFRRVSAVLERALQSLGVDARVGEVPGEYCPGEYSINARGRTKLVGLGQRIVRGASHVGGVIVVGGAGRVRDVLLPVYEALGLEWDPATSGSVQEEVGAVSYDDVYDAVRAELGAHSGSELDPDTLALAQELRARHGKR